MSSPEAELLDETGRCINCGFCEAVCPTFPASGYDGSKGARGRVMLGKELLNRRAAGEDVSGLTDSFYSCLDCYACLQVCPAGVNAGKVSHLARELLARTGNGAPKLAKLMERNIMLFHSVIPVGRWATRWSEGLSLPKGGSTILYTGQMYQLMSRTAPMNSFLTRRGETSRSILTSALFRMPSLMSFGVLLNDRKLGLEMDGYLRNIALLLRKAGVEFGYLGRAEPYPGTLLFDLGFSWSMRQYAEMVADRFRREGVRRIITVDPHTHDLLSNTYPSLLSDFDIEVVHYSELLGELEFEAGGEHVTFHEPCHLSRRFENLSSPADLLRKASRVTLPDNHGKRTHCCGGPDELLFPSISEGVAGSREKQLENAGSGRTATACPVCLMRLRQVKGITDISQILVERLGK